MPLQGLKQKGVCRPSEIDKNRDEFMVNKMVKQFMRFA